MMAKREEVIRTSSPFAFEPQGQVPWSTGFCGFFTKKNPVISTESLRNPLARQGAKRNVSWVPHSI